MWGGSKRYSRKERIWKVPLKPRPSLADNRGGGCGTVTFSFLLLGLAGTAQASLGIRREVEP